VQRLSASKPRAVVLEVSGGLEALVASELLAAGLTVAVVNPRQVREFARALGRLAKTDRRIASRYLALGDQPDLAARVLHEYDLTKKNVLAVTGHSRLLEKHRVLSWAVELRNPYVDALSHLQLRALRALRAKGRSAQERARAERLFLLTVNGVAAGLQNTG